MREYKIGQIITLPDGRRAEVVEQDVTCDGCIFDGKFCKGKFYCRRWLKIARKAVIFKEIEANKTKR